MLRTAAGLLVLAGLAWGGRLLATRWRWRIGGTDTRGRPDPVRREAGRWLARLRDTDDAATGHGKAISDLERLRYGPRASWSEPGEVFQRARHAWKSSRRRERQTKRR